MARRPRHVPSKIDKLDPQIRELIAKLRIDHGWTIDEILKRLRELGQTDISRSGLARHTRSIEEVGADLRHSRELAKALVEQVGDAPEDRMVDLNIELMHSMVLRLVTATQRGDDGPEPMTFGPEELMLLASAIQKLVGARKTNTDMVFKVREQTKKDAAAAAGKAAKAKGMSADTVQFIMDAVLGVDT